MTCSNAYRSELRNKKLQPWLQKWSHQLDQTGYGQNQVQQCYLDQQNPDRYNGTQAVKTERMTYLVQNDEIGYVRNQEE